MFIYDNDCSQDLLTRISKATEVTKSTENTWKSKNILNNTKNVYWKQLCSTQCYMGVKPGQTTKRLETNCWHLRSSYRRILRISWTERKTNREMWKTQNWKGSATKRHSEETPTVWPHMQDGRQQLTLILTINPNRNSKHNSYPYPLMTVTESWPHLCVAGGSVGGSVELSVIPPIDVPHVRNLSMAVLRCPVAFRRTPSNRQYISMCRHVYGQKYQPSLSL